MRREGIRPVPSREGPGEFKRCAGSREAFPAGLRREGRRTAHIALGGGGGGEEKPPPVTLTEQGNRQEETHRTSGRHDGALLRERREDAKEEERRNEAASNHTGRRRAEIQRTAEKRPGARSHDPGFQPHPRPSVVIALAVT